MTDRPNPRVTIVVVPRERFSTTVDCLERIYAFTEAPFRLLLIDGGSPAFVARTFRRFAARHPSCVVVRSERFLSPPAARNLALAHLDPQTEWIAWVDNDVLVHPEWLSLMLRAAEDTSARVVHPLYLVAEPGRTLIHVARAVFVPADSDGRRLVHPTMEQCGHALDAAAGLQRQTDDFVEFHTYLVHRSIQEALGPYPDLGLGDELEFSFRLRELQLAIVFEPRAVVTYVAGPPFASYDRAYFRFRWNRDRGAQAVSTLRESLPVADAYWEAKLAWVRRHRWRIQPWYYSIQQLRRRYERLRQRLWTRSEGAG